MFGIIFRIALHVGSLYIGWKLGKKISKWLKEKQNKKIWDAKRESLLRNVMRINGKYIDVKKVAQVSFERFLKLYEVSPEKWVITNESRFYDEFFPIYKYEADASEIPLFWETGEDLQKYREWVKEKFFKGEAALYQQARDESMKLLTKFIKEDLERKRKRAEEEIAELEAQVKRECEQTKKKQKEIQLTLEPQISAPVWTNEGEEPVINQLQYTTKEVESSNETSVSQSAAEFSSTCIQPNQSDYDHLRSIRDQLNRIQAMNMQAAQDYWLSQCQSFTIGQARYNNFMQSIHPFHF